MIGVYKIENIYSGRVYIGSSKNIDKRWKAHRNSLRNFRHENIRLQQDYSKDVNCYSYSIIEECEERDLLEREKFWIKHFSDNSYNIQFNDKVRTGNNLRNDEFMIRCFEVLKKVNEKNIIGCFYLDELAEFLNTTEYSLKTAIDQLWHFNFKVNNLYIRNDIFLGEEVVTFCSYDIEKWEDTTFIDYSIEVLKESV